MTKVSLAQRLRFFSIIDHFDINEFHCSNQHGTGGKKKKSNFVFSFVIRTVGSNLRFISTLLSYKSVDSILTILKQHQSILVHTFNSITDEIQVFVSEFIELN